MLAGMNLQRLIAILEAANTDGITCDDGSYIDFSTEDLEIGDADGNVVRIALADLAIAALNS